MSEVNGLHISSPNKVELHDGDDVYIDTCMDRVASLFAREGKTLRSHRTDIVDIHSPIELNLAGEMGHRLHIPGGKLVVKSVLQNSQLSTALSTESKDSNLPSFEIQNSFEGLWTVTSSQDKTLGTISNEELLGLISRITTNPTTGEIHQPWLDDTKLEEDQYATNRYLGAMAEFASTSSQSGFSQHIARLFHVNLAGDEPDVITTSMLFTNKTVGQHEIRRLDVVTPLLPVDDHLVGRHVTVISSNNDQNVPKIESRYRGTPSKVQLDSFHNADELPRCAASIHSKKTARIMALKLLTELGKELEATTLS